MGARGRSLTSGATGGSGGGWGRGAGGWGGGGGGGLGEKTSSAHRGFWEPLRGAGTPERGLLLKWRLGSGDQKPGHRVAAGIRGDSTWDQGSQEKREKPPMGSDRRKRKRSLMITSSFLPGKAGVVGVVTWSSRLPSTTLADREVPPHRANSRRSAKTKSPRRSHRSWGK